MSNHKKIDWLRWHKEKAFIRFVCGLLVALLTIILLLMFPIVSDADEITLNDKYFIGGFLNASDLKQYWSDNNIVRPNAYAENIFYDGTEMDFYDAVKDMMLNVKASDFQGSNVDITRNNYVMNICSYPNDNTKLTLVSGRIDWGFEGDGTISKYTQSDVFLYDISNKTLSNITYSIPTAGVYINLSSVVDKIITSCGTINAGGYYNGYSENYPYIDFNYLYLQNINGAGSGGFTVPQPTDSSIIDNEYIGENSFLYLSGTELNNFYMISGVDLNNSQIQELSSGDYHYQLDITLQATCRFSKGSRNAESSLLNSYGLSFPNQPQSALTVNFSFSNTITDTLTSPIIQIPSTVFNDGLVDSDNYTAVPLVDYVSSYVNHSGFTDKIDVFNYAISGQTFGPFSMPTYTQSTKYFDGGNFVYNFVLNIYKGDKLITNLPIATTYNPLTGEVNPYSNGGGKSQNDVNNTINSYNENKTPSDPDYKNPEDYKPSITPSNNDNSNSNNNNNNPSYSNNNSPSIINNASVTLPQNNTYPQSGVMSGFVKIINGEKLGSVNYVDDIIEGNQYIALCNHALSAVPQAVWDMWILAIKAILGILVSAFFLKILVNWAT